MITIFLVENSIEDARKQYEKIKAIGLDFASKNNSNQCLLKRVQTHYLIEQDQINKAKEKLLDFNNCLDLDTLNNKEQEIYWNLLNYLIAIHQNEMNSINLYYKSLKLLLEEYPDDYFGLKKLVTNLHNSPKV